MIASVDDFLSSHSVEQQSHNLFQQLVDSGFFKQREQDGEYVKILADGTAIALTKKDAAKEKVVFRVPEWIRAGEWRLRIGILQVRHFTKPFDCVLIQEREVYRTTSLKIKHKKVLAFYG